MNKKIIKRILNSVHKNFIESIKDPYVKNLVRDNSIITGGAITSLLLNEKPNDYDYYFTNKETVIAVSQYYVEQFKKTENDLYININCDCPDRVKIVVKSVGIAGFKHDPTETELMENIKNIIDQFKEKPKGTPEKFRPVFITSNAITLSNKIQLIIRFYGNPEEIHKNYDFIHCKNYWLSSENKLHLNPDALESTLSKNLFYCGSLYPVASVIRTRKFIKRGWHINAGQFIKMCFQISELDLSNIDTLEDQLTGVDNAYFYQVIDWFKKQKEKDPEFKVTEPYLISIIDKIF